jgi:hypothetical protein
MRSRTRFPHRVGGVGLAVAALLVALAACGTPTPPVVEAPDITAFTATPSTIDAGGTSTLAWTVDGTATLTLSDGTNPVAIPSGASQVDVSPSATTTYTLTATNAGGTDTAQVTVTVATAAPQITSFTASPATIGVGDDATLAWTIVGTGTVALSDGTNPVAVAPGATSVVVSPAATTTYTLTVTNAGGSDSEQVTVTVDPAIDLPNIDAFTATPASIVSGASSTLAWTVTDATSVTLDDGAGPDPVAATGSLVVSPTVSTTYTLTATNADGSVDATATVTVLLPSITSFTATPALIEDGDDSTLAWTVVGATTVTLSDGANPVAITPPGATSVDVTPGATTTYTLTATNAMGEATATATVTVVGPGDTSLTGLTATVVPGSQVRLDWNVLNATSVDVLTVANGDPDDELLVTSLAGTATTHTFALPASTRQVLRACARAALPADDVCADVTPTNVVLNVDDYDPYDIGGFVPEAEVPGTLRSVLLNAAPGSVVGFAADVTAIDLYGVALYPPGSGNVDAHLIVDKDLTISGPASGITLTGTSGYDVGVDPDDGAGGFTYRSRMLYVIPGATVELENLTITGGTFIYKGGGIHNAGTLTGRNLTVTGNRAWDVGGGIWNAATGVLTLEDSLISNNRAVTEVAEVGVPYDIRGGFTICMIRSGYGGGLYNEAGATATLIDTVVSGNEAKISGGGVYNAPGGIVEIDGGSIAGNVANHVPYTSDPAYPDPPLYSDPGDGCPEDTSAFNPYSIGGGVYNGGTLTMVAGTILNNDVNAAGGGVFIDRNLQMTTLTNVLVQGNEAGIDAIEGFGGGIQHEYYVVDGPSSNYTATNVTYGTGNTPTNITTNPIPGAAPTVVFPTDAPLPGRYVPNPNVQDR